MTGDKWQFLAAAAIAAILVTRACLSISSPPSEQRTPASDQTESIAAESIEESDSATQDEHTYHRCIARLQEVIGFVGADLAMACSRPNVNVEVLVKLLISQRARAADARKRTLEVLEAAEQRERDRQLQQQIEESREQGNTAPPCQSNDSYDSRSGNRTRNIRCSDGTTVQVGSNARTGAKWQTKYFPDGSMEGIDSCENRWTYDANTTVYANDNGERRVGLGEFRRRLRSAELPCQSDPQNFNRYARDAGQAAATRCSIVSRPSTIEELVSQVRRLIASGCRAQAERLEQEMITPGSDAAIAYCQSDLFQTISQYSACTRQFGF